jgi:DNA-binding SARP family transcriptional activator
LISILLLLISISILQGQYYGMKFSGIEVQPDQRSGLHIVDEHPIKTKNGLDLQFFLRLENDPDFEVRKKHKANYGYIFRMVIGDRHIDMVHGAVQDNPNNFELIGGGPTGNISFFIPLEELWSNWLKLRIELDFQNHNISCYVNDSILTEDLGDFDLSKGYRLMFGANSYGKYPSTDVPGMIIRDVELSYNKQSWHWPLNETEGNIAHSQPPGNDVSTVNPGWLLKAHSSWKPLINRSISGQVKAAFDAKHNELYLLTKDSVYIYSIPNDSLDIKALYSSLPLDSPNHLIYDTIGNQLLLYSLMDDYLSVYNPETNEWSPFTSGNERLTDHWHHNRMFSPDGDLLTFGGYGHHKYLNEVRKWNPDSGRFTHIAYQGEYQPRYLAASGFNSNDSLVYILGGFGSKSGRQSMSPDYYYELLSYSLSESAFSRVINFQNSEEIFCFSNKAYIDPTNSLYALRYSKHLFENKIQLVKIPLEKPEIIELGNEIDYTFLDVSSFSDLHFSKALNALVALSTYTSDDQTQVSVHSIAFPPQAFSEKAAEPVKKASKLILPLGIVLGSIFIASLLYYFRRKSKGKPKKLSASVEPLQKSKENSIILFGGFQVFDKSGQDITGQFSPLPRKLILFILLHSLRDDKGVSDNSLYETFWFGKSIENARNNRSVNVIKLKSLLENLDSTSISKDSGYLKFYFDPARVHIDYFEYLQIIRQKSDLTREQIVELLSMIEKRSFLKNTSADWLDPFKSEISNDIIDALLKYIDRSDDDDAEFLLHLTNCIFLCDSVSKEALKIQCRLLIKQGKLSLAKNAYSRFIKEYKQLYDEAYELSFKQIIEDEEA